MASTLAVITTRYNIIYKNWWEQSLHTIKHHMYNFLQMTTAADQLVFVGERLQLSVDEFQRAFNARKIPKAVSKAKEMRTRMEHREDVTLENILADIVKEAQTKAF